MVCLLFTAGHLRNDNTEADELGQEWMNINNDDRQVLPWCS